MDENIEIDGSFLEGGGQIVRTALALSTLTGKGFKVDNIRVGRKQPGLKAQHMHCVKALKELCGAEVTGGELGSLELEYKPGKFKGKDIDVDIGTAGSINLMMQSLFIPCIFADKKLFLSITGGTDTAWSPPFDYLRKVIVPHVSRFGGIDVTLEKRGFYPKGGGIIKFIFNPKVKDSDVLLDEIKDEFEPIELVEQGKLIKVKGIAFASSSLMDAQVCERMKKAAEAKLKELGCFVEVETEYSDAYSSGAGIVLWAIFGKDDEIDEKNPIILGADALGERNKRAEVVGEEAANKLLMEIKSEGAVDQHMGDNLIPFLGLVGGRMKVSSVTQHTLTNIYVVEKFLGVKFKVDGQIIEV